MADTGLYPSGSRRPFRHECETVAPFRLTPLLLSAWLMSENSVTGDDREDAKRDIEAVTKEVARDRLDKLLEWGFREERPALVEALPAVGKSYGVIKWAAATGNPVTVFTERHELYNQYDKWATDFDLTARQLPVFHQDCPTIENGDNEEEIEDTEYSIRPIIGHGGGDDWSAKLSAMYETGVSGRELHDRASSYFGEELPCQRDGTCPYMDALDQDRDGVDVLIGNFRQVFAEQYREGRYLVFDEFPRQSFIQTFSLSTVSKTVDRFVSRSGVLPFSNWRDIEGYSSRDADGTAVGTWLDEHGHDRDTTPLYRGTGGDIDVRGPLLTEIVLRFNNLENGWRRADLGDGRIAVQSPQDNEVSLLDPPPTDGAEGVLALDGTPCIEKWKLLLGEELEHRAVFSNDEKRRFLREGLGLSFIQTAGTPKPYRGGRSMTPDDDMAFIEAVKQREGQRPSLISSLAAITEYEDRDVDSLIDKRTHYNDFKGSGDLGEDRLGIVIGCDQPGDDKIQRWGALAGHSVTRQTDEDGEPTRGDALDFGPFGNRILEDSRENEVLQAAMRFGREEVDGERGATVYLHTAAVPAWARPETSIPNIHTYAKNGGVIKVIEAIKERDDWRTEEWKTSELADSITGIRRKQVRNLLRDTLAAEGYIESRRGGRGNAYLWSNKRLDETGSFGFVEW